MRWDERSVMEVATFFQPGLKEAWEQTPHPPYDHLAEATAQWLLGEGTRDDLVTVACSSLDEGFDSPIRREFADLLRVDYDRVPDLVIALMDELGYEPNPAGARGLLVQTWLTRITTGAIHPYVGAKLLVLWLPEPPRELVGWASAWEDWEDSPDGREHCENEIIREARRALGIDDPID